MKRPSTGTSLKKKRQPKRALRKPLRVWPASMPKPTTVELMTEAVERRDGGNESPSIER